MTQQLIRKKTSVSDVYIDFYRHNFKFLLNIQFHGNRSAIFKYQSMIALFLFVSSPNMLSRKHIISFQYQIKSQNIRRKSPLLPPELHGFVRPIIAAELKSQKLIAPPSATTSHKVGVSVSAERHPLTLVPPPLSSSTITPHVGVSISVEADNMLLPQTISEKTSAPKNDRTQVRKY